MLYAIFEDSEQHSLEDTSKTNCLRERARAAYHSINHGQTGLISTGVKFFVLPIVMCK